MSDISNNRIDTPRDRAMHFIQNETQFHLGFLPTEQPHPKTRGLSQALRGNTFEGIQMLLAVDDDILPVARRVIDSSEFARLRSAIRTALNNKKRIFFSGCGATGRLAILLDAANRRYWRELFNRHPQLQIMCGDLAECTRAVMTGGDFALVRSVEMFEDYITFGHHQMREAGVSQGDVVVAISEGGETSSVIGTALCGVEAGAQVFFIFNNPADLLVEKLERCRDIIHNSRVTSLSLCTGPMAVAGSTRMQATTIELLVVGAAFEAALADHLEGRLSTQWHAALGIESCTPAQTLQRFATLLNQLRSTENSSALAQLADDEADLYARGGRITYFANDHLLDIFTDTTERSPTFKIPPFRACDDTASPAPWAFVKDPLHPTPAAWRRILECEPRCLDWTPQTYIRLGASAAIRSNPPRINGDALLKYRIGCEEDLSRTEVRPNAAMAVLIGDEARLLNTTEAAPWRIAYERASGAFESRGALVIGREVPAGWKDRLVHITVDIPRTPLDLFAHLAAKLALNNVSTATMGKLGRLEGNWMAHVDASNKKLIDRSVRLVSNLAGVDYQTACIALFESMAEMNGWDEARRKTTSPAAYTFHRLSNNP